MSTRRLIVLSASGNRSSVEGALSSEFHESVSLSVPLRSLGSWTVTHWMANFSGARDNCREMLLSVADQGFPVVIIDVDPGSTVEDLGVVLSEWGLSVYSSYEHLSGMTREELEGIAMGIQETEDVFGDDLSGVTSEDLIDFLRQVWTAT